VRDPKRYHSRPTVEGLEDRNLMTTGVTASLAKGVLTVVGSSTSNPIAVDILATKVRGAIKGTVVVEGVATFQASQVKKIVIGDVTGEPLVVRRSPQWNPPIQVITRKPPPAPKVPTVKPVTPPVVTPPVVTPPASATESAAEQAIVDAVNQQRALNGLAPLKLNAKLIQAAQIHARDMANLNTMAHDLPGAQLPGLIDRANYVGYSYTTLGENIAMGFPDTASVMNGWMNSPGHRANILGASYTQIGVGIAYSTSGQPYYCQVFGQPWA
jgi:uncharacterized protein YkwD